MELASDSCGCVYLIRERARPSAPVRAQRQPGEILRVFGGTTGQEPVQEARGLLRPAQRAQDRLGPEKVEGAQDLASAECELPTRPEPDRVCVLNCEARVSARQAEQYHERNRGRK